MADYRATPRDSESTKHVANEYTEDKKSEEDKNNKEDEEEEEANTDMEDKELRTSATAVRDQQRRLLNTERCSGENGVDYNYKQYKRFPDLVNMDVGKCNDCGIRIAHFALPDCDATLCGMCRIEDVHVNTIPSACRRCHTRMGHIVRFGCYRYCTHHIPMPVTVEAIASHLRADGVVATKTEVRFVSDIMDPIVDILVSDPQLPFVAIVEVDLLQHKGRNKLLEFTRPAAVRSSTAKPVAEIHLSVGPWDDDLGKHHDEYTYEAIETVSNIIQNLQFGKLHFKQSLVQCCYVNYDGFNVVSPFMALLERYSPDGKEYYVSSTDLQKVGVSLNTNRMCDNIRSRRLTTRLIPGWLDWQVGSQLRLTTCSLTGPDTTFIADAAQRNPVQEDIEEEGADDEERENELTEVGNGRARKRKKRRIEHEADSREANQEVQSATGCRVHERYVVTVAVTRYSQNVTIRTSTTAYSCRNGGAEQVTGFLGKDFHYEGTGLPDRAINRMDMYIDSLANVTVLFGRPLRCDLRNVAANDELLTYIKTESRYGPRSTVAIEPAGKT
eukprot:GHVU01126175.1.p1 GENE.GHVU01126175.1~~GHVU01126175.1.p1  ORF type:complete len:556 (-),score=52.15 GHVU01126175.1:763-2430(-)